MAEFIIGGSLRKLARENRFLRQLLWRVDFAATWSLIKILQLLPVDTASRFGARIGGLIGPRMRRKTKVFRANLHVAFPDLDTQQLDSLIGCAWRSAGRVLGEYPHLETILKQDDRLQIEIREPITSYTDSSRPCVIVTAHQSNWEVACLAMAKLGMPNASVYSPPSNPLLDDMLLQSRAALNCQLLPAEHSARMLMRALKQGRTAAMVMDRRVNDGKKIRFFGRDKVSTLLPARLALKFDCELVPVEVQRLQDASFRVIFHAPVRPRDAHASENEQATDMIQQVHEQFEGWIRAHPEEWFCSKRLWSKIKRNPSNSKNAKIRKSLDSYAA